MTKSNELPPSFQAWRTPRSLFKALSDNVGGYGIDLFADEENHLCRKYFTAKEDAIMQPWKSSKYAFGNPPYAHGWADEAITKAILEVRRKENLPGVDLLLKCDTSTKSFLRAYTECEIFLFNRRIAFELPAEYGKPKNGNNFASMLVRITNSKRRGIVGIIDSKTGGVIG